MLGGVPGRFAESHAIGAPWSMAREDEASMNASRDLPRRPVS
jgi:hypothetical protein